MTKAAHQNKQRTSPTAIADAIKAALADNGQTVDDMQLAPAKPKRTAKKRTVTRNRKSGQRGTVNRPVKIRRNGIGWEHSVANITVSVDQANCEETRDEGPYTFAKLFFDEDERRPQQLTVRIKCDPAEGEEGLMAYSIQSGTVLRRVNVAQANLPSLNVPIDWSEGYPQIRKAHEDNCGVLLMNSIGQFVHLEIGVTARRNWRGKWTIFLNLQEMFTGQVVRSTKARIMNMGLTVIEHEGKTATVIPLYDYHAYPGNNWLGTNPVNVWGVETIVPAALDEGRSVAMHQASHEDWCPPEFGEPSEEGRVRAVVHFYNCAWLGGAGFARTEDGENVFIHWANLKGPYAPQPMTIIEFEWGTYKDKPQPRNIRVVETDEVEAEEAA